MNRRRLGVAMTFALVVVGASHCSKKKIEDRSGAAADASAHVDEAEHGGIPKRVKLSPEVIAAAGIVTAPATKEVLAATLTLPGEVSADPDTSARVASPVAGRLATVTFKEGSVVKKGELLATVRIPEIGKLRASYTAVGAKAAAARSNADRQQELADKKLAGNQEVLSAKAEADSLEAEARAIQEQLSTMGTGTGGGGADLGLRAPVSGVVVTRDAIIGQPVTTEQTIAMIANLSEVWFLGRVFEKDLGSRHVGAPAEVELNAYPKEHFDGTVEYLAKQIDPVARTITARIRLTNRNDLLALGLFGSARVAAGTSDDKKEPSLVVARDAVTEIAGKQALFVREPDGDFELHEVVVGDSSLGKTQIVSGLREGEQVVVQGVFTLKSAVLKSAFEGEE